MFIPDNPASFRPTPSFVPDGPTPSFVPDKIIKAEDVFDSSLGTPVPPKKGIMSRFGDWLKEHQAETERRFIAGKEDLGIIPYVVSGGTKEPGAIIKGVQKAGDFLGMKPLAEAFGAGLFDMTAEGLRLQEKVDRGEMTQEEVDRIKGQPPILQLAGSMLSTAALAASFGTPAPTSAWFKAGGAARQSVIIGAPEVFGASLAKGATPQQAAITTAITTPFIALFSAGAYALTNKLPSLLDKSSRKVYSASIKQSSHEIRKEVTGAAPELAEQLRVIGMKGNDAEIFADGVIGAQAAANRTRTAVASSADAIIDFKPVVDIVDTKVASLQNAGQDAAADQLLRFKQTIIDKYATTGQALTAVKGASYPYSEVATRVPQVSYDVPVSKAYQFVESVYQTLSDAAFKVDANNAPMAEAMRMMARKAREALTTASPELDAAIYEQQLWIRTIESMENALVTKYGKPAIGFSDMLMGGIALADTNAMVAGIGIWSRLLKDSGFARSLALFLKGQGEKALTRKAAGEITTKFLLNALGLAASETAP